jgi:hypothetical protein
MKKPLRAMQNKKPSGWNRSRFLLTYYAEPARFFRRRNRRADLVRSEHGCIGARRLSRRKFWRGRVATLD